MAYDAMEWWPRFELVTCEAPTGIPHGWDAELLEKGAPKGLMGRYRAAKKLTLLEDTDRGSLIVFGNVMLYGSVCLDPRTGQVVDLTYIDVATPNLPADMSNPPCLVNSSLDQFTASVRAVIGRFPFDDRSIVLTRDSTDAEDDEIQRLTDQAVEDLRELLTGIDASAMEIDGFWATFLDDVQMGDFSTKDVLSEEPPKMLIIHPNGTREVTIVKYAWENDFW